MQQRDKLKTFHISTFGCQMNLADSSTLASTLITRGYKRVELESDADLLIFNTCSVRKKAEDRVYGRLGKIYKLKKRKPHLKIAVVGCMAQRLADEIIKKAPYVDYVLGTDRVFELPDVIEGIEGTSPVMTAFGHENIDMIPPAKETQFSGFVTISRGCNNFCTYCIVPYVRGKEVSHSDKFIIDAVKKMVDEGVVEITLLGQNVNSYNYNGTNFPKLLQKIIRETEIKRLRFMTSHPKDLSKQLVDVIADEPKLMRHIHLPLQSGSDRILKRMKRNYSYDHYMKIIEYINQKLDYVSITTDLIVGFPSETEEEFEMTLDAVRAIRYDTAFMFRYSVRPGTAAANFEDDVPEEDKIRRLNKLIELQQKISYDKNQREVDSINYSVVEGFSRKSNDQFRARTEGNKTIIFKAGRNIQPGTILPVKVITADAFTLHGELEEIN
ncbi:MAG: tRNA (N6-isopentenyl adenosine(37)-C2)-methylthiotransferase MiaB [candidate division Zixibacteria bacterium]|nr:tRNA (N6-isopentenyl adenosine(37)-C2)-methylthiotransferase MiaB [candidate division Zixibacteria bacterium]